MELVILDNYRFEMFSPAGEKECKKLVKKINSKVGGEKRITLDELSSFIKDEMKKIEKTHPEIYDTEPCSHIAHLTNIICKDFGYSYKFDRFNIC